MKDPLQYALKSILNYMFNEQIDEGWPEDEGLQGLKVGETATWGGWDSTGGLNDFAPDGTYSVDREGKSYEVKVADDCTTIHIKRLS